MAWPKWVPRECSLDGCENEPQAVYYRHSTRSFVGVCYKHNPVGRKGGAAATKTSSLARYKRRPPGGWEQLAGGAPPGEG